MEETVLFKMDVSDESIKREAMKVVWTFPGVTLVDIEEKGILKVKGIFDKNTMGRTLQIIDKSVDFINPSQKADQKSYLGYIFTPKPQEMIVFEFKVLNEVIRPEVMKVIWECPGVTSVEVEKGCNIKVKGGEFDKLEMVMKVKERDGSVKTILDVGVGPDEETAEFKMDVSDESIKQKAMKVVYEFPGVTLVDIKDTKIVKVRGSKLAKVEMGLKLKMIDKSVDIINQSRNPQQSYIPGVSTIYKYIYTTKEDAVIFEFQMLNEHIIPDAMIVIWEFPGITSVERRGVEQIKVRGGQGQINKLDIVTQLKKRIDDTVEIIWFGDGPEAEKWPDVKKHSLNTSSSPIVPKPISEEAGAYARQEHEAAEKAKAELQREAPKKAKAEVPVKHDIIKKKTVNVPKLSEKRGYKRRNKLLTFFCLGC